ncbi:MAG: hypothetical protein CL681_16210 [Blastopirellula sp.]|nr:hypothetical protein [Blastopirellula sp.]
MQQNSSDASGVSARQLAIAAWNEQGGQDGDRQAQLLAEHPDLRDELIQEFAWLRMIEIARQAAEAGPASTRVYRDDGALVGTVDPDRRLTETCRVRCPDCAEAILITATHETRGEAMREGTVRCPKCACDVDCVQAAATLRAGDLLGQYELQETLGQGSFGTVWLARDRVLERDVAVKLSRTDRHSREEEDAFLSEARMAASVQHPGVVTTFEVGRVWGTAFICSEYVAGTTLARWKPDASARYFAVSRMMRQICEPLQAIHDAGIVHRDLKPSNILVDEQGIPRLTDFGIAKNLSQATYKTLTGEVLGTPAYMAPEIASGRSKEAEASADIFSMGVILFELLAGKLPFSGEGLAMLQQVAQAKPAALEDDIPEPLQRICRKCLEKDPRDRYRSADALAGDLLAFESGETVTAQPKSLAVSGMRWVERNPVLAAVLLVTLSAVAVIPLLVRMLAEAEQAQAHQRLLVNSIEEENAVTKQRLEESRQQREAENTAAQQRLKQNQDKLEEVNARARDQDLDLLLANARATMIRQPLSGLELGLQLADELVREDAAPATVKQLGRLVEAQQVLVDASQQLAGQSLLRDAGRPQTLRRLPDGRVVALHYSADPEVRGLRQRGRESFNATVTIWDPQHLARQPHRSSFVKLNQMSGNTGVLLGSDAVLKYPKSVGQPNRSAPNADRRDRPYVLGPLPRSRTGPRGNVIWKQPEAAKIVMSNDSRSIWTIDRYGDLHGATRSEDGRQAAYSPVLFSPATSESTVDLRWLDAKRTLVTLGQDSVGLWKRTPDEPRPTMNKVKEFAGEFLGASSRQERVMVLSADDGDAPVVRLHRVESSDAAELSTTSQSAVVCDVAEFDQVQQVFVSDVEDWCCIAGTMGDRAIWQWRSLKSNVTRTLARWNADSLVPALVVHPDEQQLVVATADLIHFDIGDLSPRPLRRSEPDDPSVGPVVWVGTSSTVVASVGGAALFLECAQNESLPQGSGSDASATAPVIRQLTIHDVAIHSLLVDPDAQWLISMDEQGAVRFIDLQRPLFVDQFAVAESAVVANDRLEASWVTPDREIMACLARSGKARLLRSGKKSGGFHHWDEWVTYDGLRDLIVTSDVIATLDDQPVCRIYSREDPQQPQAQLRLPAGISRLEVSEDGNWLLGLGESVAACIDLQKRVLGPQLAGDAEQIVTAAFAADAKSMVVAHPDGLLRRRALPSGEVLGEMQVDALDLSDGEALVIRDYVFVLGDGGMVAVATGAQAAAVPQQENGKREELPQLRTLLLPDLQVPRPEFSIQSSGLPVVLVPRVQSAQVMTVHGRNWYWEKIWSGPEYQLQLEQWREPKRSPVLAHGVNNDWFFRGQGESLLLWKLTGTPSDPTGPTPTRLQWGGKDQVTAAVFSPDGRYLILGFESGMLRCWRLGNGLISQMPVQMRASRTSIQTLFFVSHTSDLVVGSEHEVRQIPMDYATLASRLRDARGLSSGEENE